MDHNPLYQTLNQQRISNHFVKDYKRNTLEVFNITVRNLIFTFVTMNSSSKLVKLVIRGECNTGKSVLWSRLQGTPFIEEHIPSEEIRVATINWSSRVCGDAIIKVEVWDVVDRSRKKRRPINPSLKLSNAIDVPVAEVSLDAEFLDVYKSTAGVLFVYDITKPWTWDYIEREIVKVPAHIPILIIGNQLDMNHHRKVSTDQCLHFIDQFDR